MCIWLIIFTIAFISICTGTNTCIASYMNRSQTPVELPDMMQCHEYFINPCLCLSHYTSLSAFSHLFSQVFCSTEQSVITEKRSLPQCQFLKRSQEPHHCCALDMYGIFFLYPCCILCGSGSWKRTLIAVDFLIVSAVPWILMILITNYCCTNICFWYF